jgi:hypothetical protein
MKPIAIALIAFAASAAHAQATYRCGSTYSATPCPGGAPVATQDERSAAQAKQAAAAAKRDAKLAERMEKERVAQEKAVAGPSKLVVGVAKPAAQPASAKKAKGKAKKDEPEMITATGPKPAASKAKK